MREVFHGWRRKLGAVTLLMALLFMGEWIRSVVVADYLAFPVEIEIGGRTLTGLAAENQSLVLYADPLDVESEPVPAVSEAPPVSGPTIPDAESVRQQDEPADALSAISEAGSGVDEWTQVGPPVSVLISCIFPQPVPLLSIHFGWIVFLLSMVSAWLILRKPMRRDTLQMDRGTHA